MSVLMRITNQNELIHALASSSERPLLLFKHSTRCPVSARAYREVTRYLEGTPNDQVDYVLVHVIQDRPVSNEVEASLGVTHQSPQVILVRDGKAVWHTSHSSITSRSLQDILA